MSIGIRLYAWGKFFAEYDPALVSIWLKIIGDEAEKAFARGVNGPHSGQVAYRKGGGRFIRSAPGEYPARDSGTLLDTSKSRQTLTTVVIGTNTYYAKFLVEGTKRMAKRKMYKEAMQEGVAAAAERLEGFAHWKGVERWKNR